MNQPFNETIARDHPHIAATAPYLREGTHEKTFDIGLEALIAGFEKLRETTISRNEGR